MPTLRDYANKSYLRVRLEAQLKRHAALLTGRVLDVGSKSRRYDSLLDADITAVDIEPDAERDILAGDVRDLPFDDDAFDGVMAIEVLEYVGPNDVKTSIAELLRVTKPGGRCIISMPFMCGEHGDAHRLTERGVRAILDDLRPGNVQITRNGNGFGVCWDQFRRLLLAIQPNVLGRALLYLTIPFFRAFMLLFRLDERTDDNYQGLFIVIEP